MQNFGKNQYFRGMSKIEEQFVDLPSNHLTIERAIREDYLGVIDSGLRKRLGMIDKK